MQYTSSMGRAIVLLSRTSLYLSCQPSAHTERESGKEVGAGYNSFPAEVAADLCRCTGGNHVAAQQVTWSQLLYLHLRSGPKSQAWFTSATAIAALDYHYRNIR